MSEDINSVEYRNKILEDLYIKRKSLEKEKKEEVKEKENWWVRKYNRIKPVGLTGDQRLHSFKQRAEKRFNTKYAAGGKHKIYNEILSLISNNSYDAICNIDALVLYGDVSQVDFEGYIRNKDKFGEKRKIIADNHNDNLKSIDDSISMPNEGQLAPKEDENIDESSVGIIDNNKKIETEASEYECVKNNDVIVLDLESEPDCIKIKTKLGISEEEKRAEERKNGQYDEDGKLRFLDKKVLDSISKSSAKLVNGQTEDFDPEKFIKELKEKSQNKAIEFRG